MVIEREISLGVLRKVKNKNELSFRDTLDESSNNLHTRGDKSVITIIIIGIDYANYNHLYYGHIKVSLGM